MSTSSQPTDNIEGPPSTNPSARPRPEGPALPLQRLNPPLTATGLDRLQIYIAVDHCLPVAHGMALIQGWILDPGQRLVHVSAGGEDSLTPITILPSPMLHARVDVDRGMRGQYEVHQFVLPDNTARGFVAVVPFPDTATHLPLRVDMREEAPRVWQLPIRRQVDAEAGLIGQRHNWICAALTPFAGRLDKLPPKLLAMMAGVKSASVAGRLEIDLAVRIGSGIFVSGWGFTNQGHPLSDLLALTDQTDTPVLIHQIGRIARPDVVSQIGHLKIRDPRIGFVSWIPDAGSAVRSQQWTLASLDGDGMAVVRSVPLGNRLAQPELPTMLLHSVPLHTADFRNTYDRHTGPALDALYTEIRKRPEPSVWQIEFGAQTVDPEVSIIIPIYGRWDFIEHQLALFRHDAGLKKHELIYFIDDPAIYDGLLQYWRSTWPVYEVPCRFVYTGENLGFAGANNAAARTARGKYLLLLNSDVMPIKTGWLQTLVEALEQQPQAGVVGPTLLYGDGSIQHAGMCFERYPHWGNLWTNLHPGKGWPAEWFAGDTPREVAALTGACMLLRKTLYDELGGLDEGYIRGDFEDSDLCMKIRQKGLIPYLVPQIQLHHLERQSQDINARVDTRMLLSLFNCWRHTHRWDAALESVMAEVKA